MALASEDAARAGRFRSIIPCGYDRAMIHRSARIALIAALLVGAGCKKASSPPRDAAAPLAAPTRPSDLLVSAHFGHPRESARAIAALAATPIPFEIGMSLMLGFDSTMLAAIDLSKPVDLVVTGTPDEREVTVAFIPASATALASTLATRFRTTRVQGVGEVLSPRAAQGRESAWKCAIVGVPSAVPSRLVCSTKDRSLEHAARWVAYESARREGESGDAVLEVDGASARASMVPYVRRVIEQGSTAMGASAAQAREERPTPPDLGDPEPLVQRARELSSRVDTWFQDMRRVLVRLEVQPTALLVDVDAELDAEGRSDLAVRTASAVGARTDHPLAGRLVAESPFAAAVRAPSDAMRRAAQGLTQIVLDVLGSRVPSADTARADLEALFANAGDELALSFSRAPRQPPRPTAATADESSSDLWEFTALLSQADQGQSALALLPRLARASWLRGMRISEQPATVTTQRNALFMRLPPPRRAPSGSAEGRARSTPQRAPSELTVAVSNESLALMWGPSGREQLRRLDLRTAGAAPAVLGAASEGPFVLGVDARALRGEAPPANARLTWSAARDGSVLHSRLRLHVSEQLVRMLRRSRSE